jgi:hypothetical protein
MHAFRWLLVLLVGLTWSSLPAHHIDAQNRCGQAHCVYLPAAYYTGPLLITQSRLLSHDRLTLVAQGLVYNASSHILYRPQIETRIYDTIGQVQSIVISTTVLSAIAPGQSIPFEFNPNGYGAYQFGGMVTRIVDWEAGSASDPLPLESRILRIESSAGSNFRVVAELRNPWSVPVQTIRVVGWTMPQRDPYLDVTARPLSFWLGDVGNAPLAPQASVEIVFDLIYRGDAIRWRVAAEGTPVR